MIKVTKLEIRDEGWKILNNILLKLLCITYFVDILKFQINYQIESINFTIWMNYLFDG